ncbi:MAG: flagellar basal body protein, partial [Azonexus sp.]|nr:flagellar basal body protein [Azonexus sp.]
MSLLNVFHISSSAMTAQSMRLNAVASNLANADSIVSSDGKPYRAKQVVFEATPMGGNDELSKGVRVRQVVEDASPPRMVYD